MAAPVGRSAWTASVWGGGAAASTDKERLAKGGEACHICGDDENWVQVRLKPCDHEMCLDCVNRMRANNIYKASASEGASVEAHARGAAGGRRR